MGDNFFDVFFWNLDVKCSFENKCLKWSEAIKCIFWIFCPYWNVSRRRYENIEHFKWFVGANGTPFYCSILHTVQNPISYHFDVILSGACHNNVSRELFVDDSNRRRCDNSHSKKMHNIYRIVKPFIVWGSRDLNESVISNQNQITFPRTFHIIEAARITSFLLSVFTWKWQWQRQR